jgi:cytochrome c biogenesis factor
MGIDNMKLKQKLASSQVILLGVYVYLIFSWVVPILPSFLNPKIHNQGTVYFTILFIVTGLLILNTIAYSRLLSKERKLKA